MKILGWLGGIILLALLILWLFLGRLSLFESLNSAGKLYNGNDIIWLDSAGEIKQEFTAIYPGLAGIDILVTNPKVNQVAVTLVVRESCQTSADLRRNTVISPEQDSDGRAIYSFTFAPVDESANRKFCFELETNAANKMGVLVSYVDVYPDGELWYTPPPKPPVSPAAEPAVITQIDLPYRLFLPLLQKSEPSYDQADIAFNLHYNGPAALTLTTFGARLVAHKHYLFGSLGFYLFLLLGYLGGIILLLRVTLSQRAVKKQ